MGDAAKRRGVGTVGSDGREFGLSLHVNSGLLKSNLIAAAKPLIYCEAVPSGGYRRHVDPC